MMDQVFKNGPVMFTWKTKLSSASHNENVQWLVAEREIRNKKGRKQGRVIDVDGAGGND